METSLSTLGLSPRLLDALERIGAQTVGQLLNLPRIRLYRNQGLGQNTVRRFANGRSVWQSTWPPGSSLRPCPRGAGAGRHPPAPEQLSVDRMARLLVPGRLASEDRRILLAYLGLDNGDTAGAWLPQQELRALPSAATSSSRLCTGLANAGAGSRG